MKTLFLTVGLTLALLSTANCASRLGSFEQIKVRTNQSDPNSCRISLDADVDYTSNLTNAYTNISQFYTPTTTMAAMPAGCKFQNLTFTSFFNGDSSTVVVPYTSPIRSNYDSNGNLASAFVNTTIFANVLASMNGTECLLLKDSVSGYDQYLCMINYGGLPLYWVAYGSGSGNTFTFASFASGPSRWVLSANQNVQVVDYYAVVDSNPSFPNVVADIYSSCGSGNRNFYSLQTLITVTTPVDLSALLGADFGSNISQAYIVVKKNGSSSYLSVETSLSAVRSGQNCWTLGVTWDKVLPNMAYCAGGCQVTFIFANHPDKIFVLKTTGIKTVSNLRI